MAAARRKIQKNKEKYPAHLAKGKSDKYTAYMEMKQSAKEKESSVN